MPGKSWKSTDVKDQTCLTSAHFETDWLKTLAITKTPNHSHDSIPDWSYTDTESVHNTIEMSRVFVSFFHKDLGRQMWWIYWIQSIVFHHILGNICNKELKYCFNFKCLFRETFVKQTISCKATCTWCKAYSRSVFRTKRTSGCNLLGIHAVDK